jgi:hypothetical protein
VGVLLALAAPAWGAAPKASEFAMRVPPRATARAASGEVVTRALRAPQRFDMVGAEWNGAASADVWLRGRRLHGAWSRWAKLDPSEQPMRSGAGTEPIWVGGYDVVQLRASRPLAGLRLSFVRIDRGASASRAPRTISVPMPPPAGGTLDIVPRSAWGAARCKPRVTAGYGQVDFALVHHTTTLNSYSPSQSASIVLGICLFHRDVNGWNDIGYNMLVDKYGQVFEGRQGGIDGQVVGAHAGGFNAVATGVATLGDFSSTRLSDAGINALAHVLAWKLSLDGVPAEGRTTVVSAGGPFTPFRQGTRVSVNRISGHRDVDSTACPGDALYGQLPGLRQLVASLEGPVSHLALATPAAALPFPQPLVVSGTLAEPPELGIPNGSTVEIQDHLASGGRTLTTLPIAGGGFAGSLPIAHNDVVRAVFEGGGSLPRVVSTPIAVTVLPVVTLRASTASVRPGAAVTIRGTVAPAKRRVVIDEQRARRGTFRRVRLIKLTATGGAFSRAIALRKAGSYRFIARVAGDRQTAPGASAPVTVSAGS